MVSLPTGENMEILTYMPHGMCYQWDWRQLIIHRTTDTVIGGAYVMLSLLLFHSRHLLRMAMRVLETTQPRTASIVEELLSGEMFTVFGMFIIFCGMGHFVDVWNVTHAAYWLKALINILTAFASMAAVFMIVPRVRLFVQLPKLLSEYTEQLVLDKIKQDQIKIKKIEESKE